MELHYQLTDDEFEAQFVNKTLNPATFTHEAHLRLAKIHISKYGLEKAIHNLCQQIEAYASFYGDGDKFNITVTVAAAKAVNHFMGRTNSDSFHELIATFPRLKTGFKSLMEAHYSFEIFNNEQAKKEFLAPDLVPFS